MRDPAKTLLLDIGNTAIKLAMAHDKGNARTLPIHVEDSILIETVHGLTTEPLTRILASSVVPKASVHLSSLFMEEFGLPLTLVPNDLPVPLESAYTGTLGSDRLIAAFAARSLIPSGPLLVLDVGTAITLDCVLDKCFSGGFILPSPALALQALARETAQLPEVALPKRPSPFSLGLNTKDCIRQGIVQGTACAIDGLIAQLAQSFAEQASVIATGGMLKTLPLRTPYRQTENLVLTGLALLA
ncbi:MAG: type III pantothenate kinase [Desulfovibrionaceae bacterium]|nr:type III pantothenate kinase [Desulfovibrionaceae bacterium]